LWSGRGRGQHWNGSVGGLGGGGVWFCSLFAAAGGQWWTFGDVGRIHDDPQPHANGSFPSPVSLARPTWQRGGAGEAAIDLVRAAEVMPPAPRRQLRRTPGSLDCLLVVHPRRQRRLRVLLA